MHHNKSILSILLFLMFLSSATSFISCNGDDDQAAESGGGAAPSADAGAGAEDIIEIEANCENILVEAAQAVLTCINGYRNELTHRSTEVTMETLRQDLKEGHDAISDFLKMAEAERKWESEAERLGILAGIDEIGQDGDAALRKRQKEEAKGFYEYNGDKPGDCIAKMRTIKQLCDPTSKFYVLSSVVKSNDDYGATEPRGSRAEELRQLDSDDLKLPGEIEEEEIGKEAEQQEGGAEGEEAEDAGASASAVDKKKPETVPHPPHDHEHSISHEGGGSGEGGPPSLDFSHRFDIGIVEEALKFVPPALM